MFEKDVNWQIVPYGGWGLLTLDTKKDAYVYNAHNMLRMTDYTLINYADPENILCLGNASTQKDTNVHIAGSMDYDLLLREENAAGAKIWLVRSEDVNCSSGLLAAWRPTEYLFEYSMI